MRRTKFILLLRNKTNCCTKNLRVLLIKAWDMEQSFWKTIWFTLGRSIAESIYKLRRLLFEGKKRFNILNVHRRVPSHWKNKHKAIKWMFDGLVANLRKLETTISVTIVRDNIDSQCFALVIRELAWWWFWMMFLVSCLVMVLP